MGERDSHVPLLSVIIVHTIEHPNARVSTEGKKMCARKYFDRGKEACAASSIHSITRVFLFEEWARKNSKHEEMKACCQLVRVLKAIGFSNHAFCQRLIFKKIRNVSREATNATRCMCISFSLTRFQNYFISLKKEVIIFSPNATKKRRNCFKTRGVSRVVTLEERKETVKRLPVVLRN